MVARYTTPADLAAAAASLLLWSPHSPGDELGVEPPASNREIAAPFFVDTCRGGFVATMFPDEHGALFLGWIYEGWLFIGNAGADLLAGKPGACDLLKSQLGPQCLRVHTRSSVPPWVRVTVEFRGERARAGIGPYRAAGARLVWNDEDTRGDPYQSIPHEEIIAPECLVIIDTEEPALRGKRRALDQRFTRIGRSPDNDIVLGSTIVSGWHAHVERLPQRFLLVDLESRNGTCCNDKPISRAIALRGGDRFKIGSTVFRFLAGADVDAQYHEEIYRITITDRLTQIHNKRYFYQALDVAIIRSRRDEHELSILLFDIDHFSVFDDVYGDGAGDFVLKELARVVQALTRPDDVLARHGSEELAFLLPRSPLADTEALAEMLREHVSEHAFTYHTESIRVTIRTGTAALQDSDRLPSDLVKRAAKQLERPDAQR